MKKLNKEKMLELLQKIDDDIYLDDEVFYTGDGEPIFEVENGYIIEQIENNSTDCWGDTTGFVIHYLHQHKDEIIVDGYTKEEIKDVIENKLHLKIDDEGCIEFENNASEFTYSLIELDKFVQIFNKKSKFADYSCDLLATIVRNILDNEEVE